MDIKTDQEIINRGFYYQDTTWVDFDDLISFLDSMKIIGKDDETPEECDYRLGNNETIQKILKVLNTQKRGGKS